MVDDGAPRTQTNEGLEAVFSPRNVAIIGASPNPSSVGHALMRSILDGGFRGHVYAIHPTSKEVLGRPAYRHIGEVPEKVDLAVLAVPAAVVPDVAEECGQAGVRGLLVVSAGFREADEEGAAREEALRHILVRHGMRMVGPNCLGVINNSERVRLHATFAPRAMLAGGTALVTQSGAVGIALLEHAAHVGLGIARFASLGNKTDVSGNDLLLLWEDDPEVHLVLMYLENLGNPRNFVRIARRFTKKKPIVVLKSGRTASGAKAAGSHTGALMQSDEIVEALLLQCGVLRADGVDDLFDAGTALATQRPLTGNRIGIVTNSGGPAILAVDMLAKAGLTLADLSQATVASLKALLPAASHPSNPVDLLASGDAESFREVTRLFQDDPGVDGILAIWTPIHESDVAQAKALVEVLRDAPSKPAVAVIFGHGPTTPAFRTLALAGVPTYTFPEHAVRSLGSLHKVGAWRRQVEAPRRFQVDTVAARRILEQARPDPKGWLPMADAFGLVQAFGVRLPKHRFVADAQEAAQVAGSFGYPLVLKLDAPGLVHKTEAGAVRLGLKGMADVRAVGQEMLDASKARGSPARSLLVMEMVPPGPEILVGALQDSTFGPLIACGAGGVYTEVLKDVQFRLAPVSGPEVDSMLDALRVAPLLNGPRGEGRRDRRALAEVVARLAQLVSDVPTVREVELNPVRVMEEGAGALALDVRVRIDPPTNPQATRLR